MTSKTGAQQWAQKRERVNTGLGRMISGCIVLAASLFTAQAQAFWQQAAIPNVTQVTAIAADPMNTNVIYAAGSASAFGGLQQSYLYIGTSSAGGFGTTGGTTQWSQVNVTGMTMSRIDHIAVVPSTTFGGQTTLVISGFGTRSQQYGGQSYQDNVEYGVTLSAATGGFASGTAVMINRATTDQVSALAAGKNGNIYMATLGNQVMRIQAQSLQTQFGSQANWTPVGTTTLSSLHVVESSFNTQGSMIVGMNSGNSTGGFFVQAPGVYYATDAQQFGGVGSNLTFQPATGMPTITSQTDGMLISPAATQGTATPYYFFSVIGNSAVDTRAGLYSCQASTGLQCSRMGQMPYLGLASNSSGILYGFQYNFATSQIGALEYSTNCGQSWLPTTEVTPPQGGFVQNSVVSGNTVYVRTGNSGLYYATVTPPLTTVQCAGGGFNPNPGQQTQGLDLAISSIQYTPQQVQPGGTFSATVTVRNNGTQQMVTPATVTLNLTNATLGFGVQPPLGCQAQGTTALSCSINTMTAGQQQPFQLSLTASQLTSGIAKVDATVTAQGDLNTQNNSSVGNPQLQNLGVTIGTGGIITNPVGNRSPILGTQTIQVDLSRQINTGTLSFSDPDGDPVTATLQGNGLYGSFSLTGSSASGYTWTYTPTNKGAIKQTTNEQITISMSDGRGGANTGTLRVSFINIPVPPKRSAVHPFGILAAMVLVGWMRRRRTVA
ncbi:MAG: hypothetical protein OEZ43_07105 [Gammaproteobacteria bacterium]|nr:hypothetical protein [Gammaproteobacteria bacterium]